MLPFKNILNPTDFSEPSYKAIKVANELALHFSARLVLLNVVSLTPLLAGTMSDSPGINIATYQKMLEDDARRKMREIIDTMISKDIKLFVPMITSGNYAEEIRHRHTRPHRR